MYKVTTDTIQLFGDPRVVGVVGILSIGFGLKSMLLLLLPLLSSYIPKQ